MIVTRSTIASTLKSLRSSRSLAIDSETTGLRPYHGDTPFAVIISDGAETFYFDFSETAEWKPDPRQMQEDLFATRCHDHCDRIWFFANAKFDLAMLETLGASPIGIVHDLAVHERLLDSTLFGAVFSLEATAERYGFQKSDAVKPWLRANGGTTKVLVEGKAKQETAYHFDRAPKELIVPYAETDGRITHAIGSAQYDRLEASEHPIAPSMGRLVAQERALTRVVYDMERAGALVDLPFCREAAAFEGKRERLWREEFKALAGTDYVSSAKCLTPLFSGCDLRRTPKGAACFDSEALATYDHPLSPIILGIRDAKSKADYYHGFIHHADVGGRVHSSFNQHQARTGRFSSSAPNLQNLSKNDDEADAPDVRYQVRRAFIPPPGFFLAMFDYDQVEYRLMLDYSGARGLIEKILGGLDVHQATADLAKITRPQAKTANFLTIYGGGDGVLASKLRCTVAEAKRLRQAIKDAAPENDDFIRECIHRAESRGFVWTWLGRRLYFPDRETCFRAANGVIQGGAADINKAAMVAVAQRLRGMRTRMILTVHDELVFEVAEEEAHVLPEIKDIMEGVYKWTHLPLTVAMDHSFKSLADKVRGYPDLYDGVFKK